MSYAYLFKYIIIGDTGARPNPTLDRSSTSLAPGGSKADDVLVSSEKCPPLPC